MSRYIDLRDKARADRYSPPDELHYALETNADDMLWLWQAADRYFPLMGGIAISGKSYQDISTSVEALRPLFGEEDGNQ